MPEVRGYIEQLTANGLLRQTDGEFPVLELTSIGVALLKDPGTQPGLTLARLRRPTKDRAPRRARVEAESWQDVDRDLFDRLRNLRLTIARSRGVPPYVIFHDTTLRDMARVKPTSVEALRNVYGVGKRKATDLDAVHRRIREATQARAAVPDDAAGDRFSRHFIPITPVD